MKHSQRGDRGEHHGQRDLFAEHRRRQVDLAHPVQQRRQNAHSPKRLDVVSQRDLVFGAARDVVKRGLWQLRLRQQDEIFDRHRETRQRIRRCFPRGGGIASRVTLRRFFLGGHILRRRRYKTRTECQQL